MTAVPEISVAFTRPALGLAPLAIDQNPRGTRFHLPEDGIGAVAWDLRRQYAPDSAWLPGKTLLAAVREASTLPLVIYAHEPTSVALEAAKAELEAAAGQWSYQVTVTVDGAARTYNAEPSIPQWGGVDTGMVRAHMARAVLVIPVNPS